MKLYSVLSGFLALSLFGCTKTENVTNNIPVYTYPGFTVQGITDISLSRNSYAGLLNVNVMYHDSNQERVQLSLSDLPAGISLGSNWLQSGYPTFSTSLSFFDTVVLNPALPGIYPMTLTATGERTGTKKYTFNIFVQDIESITESFIKTYPACSIAGTTGTFADSVVKDAQVTNKVWFKNFANTGTSIAAIFTGSGGSTYSVAIPTQQAGSYTISGTGMANPSTHLFRVTANINGTSKSITMN